MKILLVNQFYWPGPAPTGQLLDDVALHLHARGDEVHVLCSADAYGEGSEANSGEAEAHAGIHIHRLKGFGGGKKSMLSRMLDYAGFHLKAGAWVLSRAHQFDVIVSLTTPPLIGVWGHLAKTLYERVKHVVWAMDLHPDCGMALGLQDREAFHWQLMQQWNDNSLREADSVVGLGEAMASVLENKGVARERITLIPPWTRATTINPSTYEDNPLREQLGLKDKFVVMYSGNAGLMHDFEGICETMLRLKDETQLCFLFVGSGKRMQEVEAFAEQHAISNFKKLPYFPREQLNESLTLGDVHLVSLRDVAHGLLVPSKTYGIMAAGRPMIYVGPLQSDSAQAIAQADAGWLVEPDDADELTTLIQEMLSGALSEELARRGANGRTACENDYDAAICTKHFTAMLDSLKAK